jgi:hypothetical protein
MGPTSSAGVAARSRLVKAQGLGSAAVKGAVNAVAQATQTLQSAAGPGLQRGAPGARRRRRSRLALRADRSQAQGMIVRGSPRRHAPALAPALAPTLAPALNRDGLNGFGLADPSLKPR